MEKSFLSFAATYSTWEPDSHAKRMLASLQMQPGHHLHGLQDQAPHLLGAGLQPSSQISPNAQVTFCYVQTTFAA